MKRFLTILFTTLLLTAALCVTASASNYDAAAKDLSAIGMFRGTANGFELDRAPTRSEAAIMLVRLYGAEDAAKAAYEAGEITHPFTDVSSFTSPYVAWLYDRGITNGTSSSTFGSSNPCSAQNYVVFLLRALGYQDGTDFQYADALTFAAGKGLLDTSLFSGTFLRDDLVAVTYQALACDLKDGSTYLLDSLVKSGAIDAAAATPMTEKIETYRTLLSTVDETMGTSLDTDVDMKMNMIYTVDGMEDGTPVQERESMDMTAAGNIKMILGDDIQMAVELKMQAMDETIETGMWMKDGWMYSRSGETAYKYRVDDQLGVYQELLNQSMSQMNVSMLPMIDSITAKKSNGSTVYTMNLNDALFGMVNNILDMLGGVEGTEGLDLDLSTNNCTYTYTVDNKGRLQSATAVMGMTMGMSMDAGEYGYMNISIDVDVDMDMDINATGTAVKISYPADLSEFPEISGDDTGLAA